MDEMKEKVIKAKNFIKSWILQEKLKSISIGLVILMLIGFFTPFMSAKTDITLKGLTDRTLKVIEPENEIISTNLGDFILQKPIDSLQIFGFTLGDIQIFGVPALDILRRPVKEGGIIQNINTTLNSSALDFLVDPEVQKTISTFEAGDNINAILTGTWNILQNAKTVASNINEATEKTKDSMEQVNAVMRTVDSAKSTANGIILCVFIVAVALLVSLFVKRAPLGLLIGLSAFLFGLFLITGISIFAVNNVVNDQLAFYTGQINAEIINGIKSVLMQNLGNTGAFIAGFLGSTTNFLSASLYLQLQIGYWIILITSGATLGIMIALRYKNQKLLQPEDLEESIEQLEESKEIEQIKKDTKTGTEESTT